MFKRSVFFRKRKYNLLVGFISLLIITSSVNAQTFKSSNVKLYDFFNRFFIQEIPIEVLGLPNAMNDSFGLESIQLSLHHNRTSDLKIQLQAPDGTTVWVTNRNGGLDGKNYIKTHFSQYGKKRID
ncbi:MAG: proprotein convertase P-domain-containing protein [Chitinophagaceae bacterium]|nr:proprotein convertase P-domain-containing protein [Chitinophagaceae bacterium]